MGITPANDFNALSWLSPDQLTPAIRQKLLAMALNGDSIVNPLGAGFDDERTPQGRARREREVQEERAYEMVMAQLEERRVEFQRELGRLDHASLDALRENEEHLREAREELQRIRDNAYQIHMPDGTVERVYRDGDKVRMESGAEVSPDIVRAEDLGNSRPTWQERTEATKRIDDLSTKHQEIVTYREHLHEADGRNKSGTLSADEIDALARDTERTMPESVRIHYRAPATEAGPGARNESADHGLTAPFANAAAPNQTLTLSDRDFEAQTAHPAASAPAPR